MIWDCVFYEQYYRRDPISRLRGVWESCPDRHEISDKELRRAHHCDGHTKMNENLYREILGHAKEWEAMREFWGTGRPYVQHMQDEGFIVPKDLAERLRADLSK